MKPPPFYANKYMLYINFIKMRVFSYHLNFVQYANKNPTLTNIHVIVEYFQVMNEHSIREFLVLEDLCYWIYES